MTIKFPPGAKLGIVLTLSIALIAGGLLIWNKNSQSDQDLPEEGAVFGHRTQALANFPSEIPLFKPAAIRSSTQSRNRIHLVLETEESLATVLNFYREEAKKGGWKGTEIFKPKGGEAWSYSKDGRRFELIAVHNETEGKTLIFLKTNLP